VHLVRLLVMSTLLVGAMVHPGRIAGPTYAGIVWPPGYRAWYTGGSLPPSPSGPTVKRVTYGRCRSCPTVKRVGRGSLSAQRCLPTMGERLTVCAEGTHPREEGGLFAQHSLSFLRENEALFAPRYPHIYTGRHIPQGVPTTHTPREAYTTGCTFLQTPPQGGIYHRVYLPTYTQGLIP